MKYKKRKLFYLSYNFCMLRILIISLVLLKKLIVYRIRGLLLPKKILFVKPGKKRF